MTTLAILGNHLPRHCGIATFTTDLADAIAGEHPELDCFVLAMNEAGKRHAYPERVRYEVSAPDPESYRGAGDFLASGPVDLLSVQHEFGIYGGDSGEHVLALLRDVRVPVVTTLHTILAEPSASQRRVMDGIVRLSDRLVVMSEHGARLLARVHAVPEAKIDVIPHGIPDVPADEGAKARLGLAGRPVILTFGLLSPDKGIEHVIEALPAILAVHPETVYVVLGATHPHVRENQGEAYRESLAERARTLGVSGAVVFHDRFVGKAELVSFLSAADVYVTPYLNPEQITSGTLAYALGAGKAVISTPYSYARELLADGRGLLVPPRDSGAIAREVVELFSNHGKRNGLKSRGAAYGRNMLWPEVARSYVRSFDRAREDHDLRARSGFRNRVMAERPSALPDLRLDHLRELTDETGILQHAVFTVPRYGDGYCLDDNARALLLATLLEGEGAGDARVVSRLGGRYLAFVQHSFERSAGRFRNFLSYERSWDSEPGSEDAHGRALWALGSVVGRAREGGRRRLASSLFEAALPAVPDFTSPRAFAYALLGIEEALRERRGDARLEPLRDLLATRLLDLFDRSSSPTWPWFEEAATYCNARLPQALLVAGFRMRRDDMKTAALRALAWLAERQCSSDGSFAPIGSNGFHPRNGPFAEFDQQPVEAHAMVSACLLAHRETGDRRWEAEAHRAFNWFLGRNHLRRSLYDEQTGGCRDGLHEERANENQGAESTLSFLLALVEMRGAGDDRRRAGAR